MVLGGGEDMETLPDWLSKVTLGVLGISKEGIILDVFSAAERQVQQLMFKANVGKSAEVAKSVSGPFEAPCASRDETGIWVAVIFYVNEDVLLNMGIAEKLVV